MVIKICVATLIYHFTAKKSTAKNGTVQALTYGAVANERILSAPAVGNLAPLPKGGWIFNRLRLKKNGGFSYKLWLNLMELDFSPSVTCGDTSLVRGRLPSGFLVIPHPFFSPCGEKSTFPSGKAALRDTCLRREQSPRPTVNWLFCGTVKTVPYGWHKNGRPHRAAPTVEFKIRFQLSIFN